MNNFCVYVFCTEQQKILGNVTGSKIAVALIFEQSNMIKLTNYVES